MAKQVVCDRCSKVLTTKDGLCEYPSVRLGDESYNGKHGPRVMYHSFDLCKHCHDAVKTFITNGASWSEPQGPITIVSADRPE